MTQEAQRLAEVKQRIADIEGKHGTGATNALLPQLLKELTSLTAIVSLQRNSIKDTLTRVDELL